MKRSFTLIELMLVVIIIGILASFVVPRLAGRAERARKVVTRADIESNIPAALDLYEMDLGEYPQRLEDLMVDSSSDPNWNGPYLKKLPKDPWGRAYYYKCPGEHDNDYDLASSGRDGVMESDDDIISWE